MTPLTSFLSGGGGTWSLSFLSWSSMSLRVRTTPEQKEADLLLPIQTQRAAWMRQEVTSRLSLPAGEIKRPEDGSITPAAPGPPGGAQEHQSVDGDV